MAKYSQGYSDRKDEYLGMRNGKEDGKNQSYQSRRGESYGMSGVMGHEKQPRSCDAFAAQKKDYGRVDKTSMTNRGNPQQAWDYKY